MRFNEIFHTASVSGYVKHYIFKSCPIIAGVSMISQFHEFFWISFLADFCYLSQLYAIAAACFGLLILHWSMRAPPPTPLDAFLDSILKEEFQRKAAKFSLQLHIMYSRVAEHYILEQGHAQAEFSFFFPSWNRGEKLRALLILGES